MVFARLRRLRRLAFLLLAAVAAALHFGCGSSGGGTDSGTLTGLVETDRFEVPAGQTQQVTGDTTIRSTGDVLIAGDLKVTPGSSLALVADGDLAIDGTIGPAGEPGSTRTRDDAGLADSIVLFAPRIRIGTAAIQGEPASETRTIEAPAGTNVFIAVPPDDPAVIGDTTVVLNGAVVAGDGEDALAPDEPGEGLGALPGCNVEIGTAQAIAKADEASGSDTAMAPSQIRLESLVMAVTATRREAGARLGEISCWASQTMT